MDQLRNNQYKEFIFKSQKRKDNLEKFYILSLQADNIKDDIPYVLKIDGMKKDVLGIKIDISNLKKNLAIFDTTTNRIIYENKSLNNVDLYLEDLYKIDKNIITLRNNINKLEFYMLNDIFKIIDIIKLYLTEYKESAKYVGSVKVKEIIPQLENRLNQFENSVFNRASFIDMKSSRMLTILSLMTLIPIALFTWLSSDVPEEAKIIRKSIYTYWIILFITLFIIIVTILYFFEDLFM